MNKQLVLSDCIRWLQNLMWTNTHPLLLDPTTGHIKLSCPWACFDVRTDTSPTENNLLIQPGEEKINGKCGLKPKNTWPGITRTDGDSCSNEDSLVLPKIAQPFSPSHGLPEPCASARAEIAWPFISSRKMRTGQWLDRGPNTALAITCTGTAYFWLGLAE